MKKLLDKLMARQQRLMDELTRDERGSAVSSGTPEPVTPERLAAEADAIARAFQALDAGDLAGARAALQPFAEDAARVETLGTLARIASAEGHVTEALELLRRAERMSPSDVGVWQLLADTLKLVKRYEEEVQYRRKLAFADGSVPASAAVDWVRSLLRASEQRKLPLNEIRLATRRLEAADDVTPALRLCMAETLYACGGALIDDARAIYDKAAALPAGQRAASAEWVRMTDWCLAQGMPLTRLTDEGIPAHRPSIVELSDVDIYPALQWLPVLADGTALFEGQAPLRLKLRSEDAATPLVMSNGATAELRLNAQLPVVDTPALLIGGLPRYYHHTVEFLSGLAIAEATGIGADLPLVVNEDLAPFQIEQLALLGYSEQRLIRVPADRPTRFERLVVTSRLVQGGRWIDPMVPRWYRQRLVKPVATLGRRLYLTRRSTHRGRVADEAALIDALATRGFEVVEPECLSVREQVDLFAQASHIVGPGGAALTNMLFAAPGAAVLVLANRHLLQGSGDTYYEALAIACGHRSASISCAPAAVQSGQRVVDADLAVDVSAVLAALDALEERPGPAVSA